MGRKMKGSVKIDPYSSFIVKVEGESSDNSQDKDTADGQDPQNIDPQTTQPQSSDLEAEQQTRTNHILFRSQSFIVEGNNADSDVTDGVFDAEIPEVSGGQLWRGDRKTRNRRSSLPGQSNMDGKPTVDRSLSGETEQEKKERWKVMSFFKKKFSRRRGKRETSVQEIHIDPDEGEDKWACRSVSEDSSGSTSRGSSGGGGSTVGKGRQSRNSSENYETRGLEVVHDMSEEYSPYHVS